MKTTPRSLSRNLSGMVIAIGGIIGAINDILSPLLPLAGIAVSFIVLLLIVAIMALISPKISRTISRIPAPTTIKEFVATYWAMPIFTGLILLCIFITGAKLITMQTEASGGFFASAYPKVNDFKKEVGIIQNSLGDIAYNTGRTALNTDTLVDVNQSIDASTRNIDASTRNLQAMTKTINALTQSIEASTRNIEATSKETALNTGAIAGDTKNIDETAKTLKKETSLDPQKELANMGLPWTNDAFGQALIRADVKVVELFLKGGWNARSHFREYDSSNALMNFIRYGHMSNPRDIEKIVDLIIESGVTLEEKAVIGERIGEGIISRSEPIDMTTAAVGACNLVLLKILIRKGGSTKIAKDRLLNRANMEYGYYYVNASRSSPFYDNHVKDRAEILKILGLPVDGDY
jgi:hypothetical protein